MMKKLLSFVIVLAMILSMVSTLGAVAVSAADEPSGWELLQTAVQGIVVDDNEYFYIEETDANRRIFLIKDIECDYQTLGGINVSSNSSIMIVLSGHKIDRKLQNSQATNGGFVIKVESGSTLYIYDNTANGMITGGNNTESGGGIYVESGAALEFITGLAVSNNKAKNGGGIYGETNAVIGLGYPGVKLNANTASEKGGSIYNEGSIVGKAIISSSSAITGGGIYNEGYCEISGTMETCNATNGGAAYVAAGGWFEFAGMKISTCSAVDCGGAVYVEYGGTATFINNGKISECFATNAGGAIWNNGAIGFENATISDCEITNGQGAGVYNGETATVFLGNIVKVLNNKIGDVDNNLYISEGTMVKFGTGEDVTAPAFGMKVGITIYTEPAIGSPVKITTNGAAEYAKYLVSDSSSYGVILKDGHLELSVAFGITYKDKGDVTFSGTHDAGYPTEHFYGADTTLKSATKDGYIFEGWFTTSDCSGVAVTTLGAAVFTSDITLYAKWAKVPDPAPVYYGGSETYYDVNVAASENGTLSVDKKNTYSGGTVKVTVTPKVGFTLETLTVLDRNGKEIEVKETTTKNQYSFKMPSRNVTVSATFMEDNTILNYCVDVKSTDYFYESVIWSYENEICNGVDALHFCPNATMTRAQAVTLLWRIAGEPVVNYFMRFKDVESERFYTEAVRWAASEKIASGYSTETFGVNDPVTREQFATMIYRYVQKKGQGFTGSWMFLLPYNDRADISEWANEAAHWCSMKGIINGKAGNIFDPQGLATRAEAVTMLYRWMEN